MCMCLFVFFSSSQCSSSFSASPFYMLWWLLLLHSLVFRFPSILVDSFAQKHRGTEKKYTKRRQNKKQAHNSQFCWENMSAGAGKAKIKKNVYNVHTHTHNSQFTYVIKMYMYTHPRRWWENGDGGKQTAKKMRSFYHWYRAHTVIEPNQEVSFRREHAVHTIHANETLMNRINNIVSAQKVTTYCLAGANSIETWIKPFFFLIPSFLYA